VPSGRIGTMCGVAVAARSRSANRDEFGRRLGLLFRCVSLRLRAFGQHEVAAVSSAVSVARTMLAQVLARVSVSLANRSQTHSQSGDS